MIVMQMLRSAVAQEILVNLVSELRSYEDHCPADPDAFVKFAETRIMGGGPGQEASGEPLTIVERAVFELLSNGVFENRHTNPAVASEAARTRVAPASGEDVLTPYYPLLLHNAYALFHSTPEGHEMLVHLALALGLYEHNDASVSGAAARDTLIASDRFIPLLVKSYPELRHRWSALALSWACNSLDQSVAAVSFTLWSQLESPSFFFGEHSQENLVRAELQLFLTLRRNDTQNLKSIVSTLISPTAYPYDKQGWCVTHAHTAPFFLFFFLPLRFADEFSNLIEITVTNALSDCFVHDATLSTENDLLLLLLLSLRIPPLCPYADLLFASLFLCLCDCLSVCCSLAFTVC